MLQMYGKFLNPPNFSATFFQLFYKSLGFSDIKFEKYALGIRGRTGRGHPAISLGLLDRTHLPNFFILLSKLKRMKLKKPRKCREKLRYILYFKRSGNIIYIENLPAISLELLNGRVVLRPRRPLCETEVNKNITCGFSGC